DRDGAELRVDREAREAAAAVAAGREQDELADALAAAGDGDRDGTAERVADDRAARDAERLEHRDDVVGEALQARSGRGRARAEAGQVDRDAGPRRVAHERAPRRRGAQGAVEEQERLARAVPAADAQRAAVRERDGLDALVARSGLC